MLPAILHSVLPTTSPFPHIHSIQKNAALNSKYTSSFTRTNLVVRNRLPMRNNNNCTSFAQQSVRHCILLHSLATILRIAFPWPNSIKPRLRKFALYYYIGAAISGGVTKAKTVCFYFEIRNLHLPFLYQGGDTPFPLLTYLIIYICSLRAVAVNLISGLIANPQVLFAFSFSCFPKRNTTMPYHVLHIPIYSGTCNERLLRLSDTSSM